jgi:stress response protein YsnF
MENAQFDSRTLTPGSMVFDTTGEHAQVVASEQTDGSINLLLQRPQGQNLRLPQAMLRVREDGNYLLPTTFSAIDHAAVQGEKHVIPVVQEELQISKRTIDTGHGIRVHQRIVERSEVVDEPLYEDVLELNRISVGKIVEPGTVPTPRQEGETLIVPVLEEVLVIERRLCLKEELHITRHKREVHKPQSVVLKSQEVSIEHFDEKMACDGTPPISNNPKEDTNNPGRPAR